MTEFHLTDEEVHILDLIECGQRDRPVTSYLKFGDALAEKSLVEDGLIEKRMGCYYLTVLGQKELDKYS
jgi:hypothetical protein